MVRTWLAPPALPEATDRALADFSPIQRNILYARGLETREQADDFFGGNPGLEHNPFELMGMGPAVERLSQAIDRGEFIVVYGDYDTDGVTATAILCLTLAQQGGRVSHYIPDRFDEGYGLNVEALRTLRAQGAGLVVSVDCGIRSVDEATHAVDLGLDLIVTDHHQPGPSLPPALAVVSPSQPGDPYPFKHLTGAGVAYKLAAAMSLHRGTGVPDQAKSLVAIGTIADMAPLTLENRKLVREGLVRLNRDPGPGLHALAKVSGYALGRITATAIGFGLAPRLNAAGRLESADLALRLILEQDSASASKLAGELDRLNRSRQAITNQIVEQSRDRAASEQGAELIFAADPSFNEGVIGLAAARLMQEFYRPAIVARQDVEFTRGSARSIPEFDITRALDTCADLLVRYGGHAGAAGFTVRTVDLEELLGRLKRLASDQLGPISPQPTLQVDADAAFGDLDHELLEFLEKLEPCGVGNATPVLRTRQVEVLQQRPVGAQGRHLKLTLSQGLRVFDAIAFRQGHLSPSLPDQVDVAYHFERNVYQGVESLQLNVVDLQPAL